MFDLAGNHISKLNSLKKLSNSGGLINLAIGLFRYYIDLNPIS